LERRDEEVVRLRRELKEAGEGGREDGKIDKLQN